MSILDPKYSTLARLLSQDALDDSRAKRPTTSLRLASLLGADNSGQPFPPSGIGLAALSQPTTRLGLLARALVEGLPRPDSEAFIQAVWEKASLADGYDGRYIRKDRFGALIARSRYGMQIELGWHIDHIVAAAKGGSDELYNREPLHWRNNLTKSDRII